MGNPGWRGKTRLGNAACRCLLLLGNLVSQENFCRLLLLVCGSWWGILVGEEKQGWEMTLFVACRCWEPWLAEKTAAECCCWLVAAGGESWLARKKTKLGNTAGCLLLVGTLDSQENCCRLLLLSYSCWWGILVGEKKTRLGNDSFRCLPLLGTLVSRENRCRMLLLVGSCWWRILVGQNKN